MYFYKLSHFVPAPPTVNSARDDLVFLKVGRRGSILCDIVGTRRKPAWYYNNTPLSNSPAFSIRERELKIANVSLSHSGWYTCAAANEYGRTERDFLVIAGGVCVCV